MHWITAQKSQVLFIRLSPIIPKILNPFIIANSTITRSLPRSKLRSLPCQFASSITHFLTTQIKRACVVMQAALAQHVRRAAFQVGHVWGRSLDSVQELPSASDWGWLQSSDGWVLNWTSLPEASKACSELIRCGCKQACQGLCKCTRANLPCTALCTCNGSCYQE